MCLTTYYRLLRARLLYSLTRGVAEKPTDSLSGPLTTEMRLRHYYNFAVATSDCKTDERSARIDKDQESEQYHGTDCGTSLVAGTSNGASTGITT